MNYLNGSDTSDPVGPLPGQVVMGYAGGWTPHEWTHDQWEFQTAEFLLPIWVGNAIYNPIASAWSLLAWLGAYKVLPGSAYVLDAEGSTNVDSGWVNAFADVTAEHHYGCHVYASVNTIFSLPPRAGYIVADWTGKRHMYEHPFVSGTQWADEGTIDRDVFVPQMHLWRNPYVGH
jgi:hypothetical protein